MLSADRSRLFATRYCIRSHLSTVVLFAACNWQVGPEGAGHFVKMVHNGIEYGDMQLICEAYQLMKQALGMSNDEISEVRPVSYLLIFTLARGRPKKTCGVRLE